MILGIDPGPERSAIVLLNDDGVIWQDYLTNADILDRLSLYEGAALAIEWLQSYGNAMGPETLHTARWVGAFQHAFGDMDAVLLVTRSQILKHFECTRQGADTQLKNALIARYGPSTEKEWVEPIGKTGKPLKGRWQTKPGPLAGVSSSHGFSALAVATYAKDKGL